MPLKEILTETNQYAPEAYRIDDVYYYDCLKERGQLHPNVTFVHEKLSLPLYGKHILPFNATRYIPWLLKRINMQDSNFYKYVNHIYENSYYVSPRENILSIPLLKANDMKVNIHSKGTLFLRSQVPSHFIKSNLLNGHLLSPHYTLNESSIINLYGRELLAPIHTLGNFINKHNMMLYCASLFQENMDDYLECLTSMIHFKVYAASDLEWIADKHGTLKRPQDIIYIKNKDINKYIPDHAPLLHPNISFYTFQSLLVNVGLVVLDESPESLFYALSTFKGDVPTESDSKLVYMYLKACSEYIHAKKEVQSLNSKFKTRSMIPYNGKWFYPDSIILSTYVFEETIYINDSKFILSANHLGLNIARLLVELKIVPKLKMDVLKECLKVIKLSQYSGEYITKVLTLMWNALDTHEPIEEPLDIYWNGEWTTFDKLVYFPYYRHDMDASNQDSSGRGIDIEGNPFLEKYIELIKPYNLYESKEFKHFKKFISSRDLLSDSEFPLNDNIPWSDIIGQLTLLVKEEIQYNQVPLDKVRRDKAIDFLMKLYEDVDRSGLPWEYHVLLDDMSCTSFDDPRLTLRIRGRGGTMIKEFVYPHYTRQTLHLEIFKKWGLKFVKDRVYSVRWIIGKDKGDELVANGDVQKNLNGSIEDQDIKENGSIENQDIKEGIQELNGKMDGLGIEDVEEMGYIPHSYEEFDTIEDMKGHFFTEDDIQLIKESSHPFKLDFHFYKVGKLTLTYEYELFKDQVVSGDVTDYDYAIFNEDDNVSFKEKLQFPCVIYTDKFKGHIDLISEIIANRKEWVCGMKLFLNKKISMESFLESIKEVESFVDQFNRLSAGVKMRINRR